GRGDGGVEVILRCRPGAGRDPYAAADVVEASGWTAFPQQLLPVIMGPGLCRDDSGVCGSARLPRLPNSSWPHAETGVFAWRRAARVESNNSDTLHAWRDGQAARRGNG